MKNLPLILSVLLFGCGTTEPDYKEVNNSEKIDEVVTNVSVEDSFVLSHSLPATHLNDSNSEILAPPNAQGYSAQKSIDSILSLDDPRKVVYLVHPTRELLVYCYHNIESECYIEGVHNSQFFKYNISQVEGQNMGKLTFHTHNIESSKTTPTEWMTINDEYVQVLMTSKIMLNSQQNTLHEPLVIYYKTGMMVR